MISNINLEFLNKKDILECTKELNKLDVGDPIRDNYNIDEMDGLNNYTIDNLEDWELKLNGSEDEFLPIISKYARGNIEVQGDEPGDFRKWIVFGNGEYEKESGQLIYKKREFLGLIEEIENVAYSMDAETEEDKIKTLYNAIRRMKEII